MSDLMHKGDGSLSRRQFLIRAGTSAAAGLVVVAGSTTLLSSCAAPPPTAAQAPATPTPPAAPPPATPAPVAQTADNAKWPWSYKKLDPELIRKTAHQAYYEAGCCYGAFHGIVSVLQKEVGAPYTNIPTQMMKYGEGGVAGWGTLCGALNGASAAITLVSTDEDWRKLINELMGWYGGFSFPSDESNRYAEEGKFLVAKDKLKYAKALPQNASKSPLCHASVTEWCQMAGYSAGSNERKERCARLTADVAAYAITLLNKQADKAFTATYKAPADTQACMACHQPTSEFKAGGFVQGKMECAPCHGSGPHNKT